MKIPIMWDMTVMNRFLVDSAYWDGIAPRERLLNMIAKNYVNPNESVGYSSLADLDISEGADFYAARQAKNRKAT